MKCPSNSSSKAVSFTVKSNPSFSNSGQKIAILGGGLAGRLLAWRLASYKETNKDNGISFITKIQVFEKGTLNPDLNECEKAAAFTAAAMISPMSELVASELEIYHLGQASLALWPQWLKQLNCLQYFHAHGSLILAHTNDLGELHQFQRDLDFKLQDSELQHLANTSAPYQLLQNQQQIAVLEPNINPNFQQGLFIKNEAHIDHLPVLDHLVDQAKKLGVNFTENCAIEPNDEVLKDYDIIFDCRGTGLKETGFRGVRGEVIRIECKEITLKRPIRLMHPRYKLYIVPKPNHQFVIGATEIESEDRSKISLRSSLELMSALYAVNPAFAEARIISQETNLRPAYMNNLPRIDTLQSTHDKTIIRVNGLYRHGYLIGPAVIEQAIQKALL
jgi:glycine oxidase